MWNIHYKKRGTFHVFVFLFNMGISVRTQRKDIINKKKEDRSLPLWALTDSNRRPSACKADALNQLS